MAGAVLVNAKYETTSEKLTLSERVAGCRTKDYTTSRAGLETLAEYMSEACQPSTAPFVAHDLHAAEMSHA